MAWAYGIGSDRTGPAGALRAWVGPGTTAWRIAADVGLVHSLRPDLFEAETAISGLARPILSEIACRIRFEERISRPGLLGQVFPVVRGPDLGYPLTRARCDMM